MLDKIGELLVSIVIGYMGAVEFFFVMRHLFHWTCHHHDQLVNIDDSEQSLSELKQQIEKSIVEAKEKEKYGLKAMKDGVLYKDGFRVDPAQLNEESKPRAKREIIGSSRNSLEKEDGIAEKITHQENENTATKEVATQEIALTEVAEEPVIKTRVEQNLVKATPSPRQRSRSPAAEDELNDDERIRLTQTVKTQFGQTSTEHQLHLRSPSRLQLGRSDDSSSNEPVSQKSSISTQQSSSLDTTVSVPEMHFDEYERQEPDGEDFPDPNRPYSDDYLRSLDGLGKNRPLVRDDGTGRRRAFKKRRSSGDSTSSRESKLSREEELKMFTSLEEEEFASIKRGDDYTSIKYSSDPNLKVKHNRRHKRSPVKDVRLDSEDNKGSLEILGEEDSNPWGELKPEHYKDSEFWKREKTISIEEELDEITNSTLGERESSRQEDSVKETAPANSTGLSSSARNIPKMSSFEEATHSQHEEAISVIKKQGSKDVESSFDKPSDDNGKSGENRNVSMEDKASLNANALLAINAFNENPQITEENQETKIASDQSYEISGSNLINTAHETQVTNDSTESSSPGLRRSPRMDEMDHYEERWENKEEMNSSAETNSEVGQKIIIASLEIRPKSREGSTTPEILEVEEPTTVQLVIERREIITIGAHTPSTPHIEVEYPSDDEDNNEIRAALHIEDDEEDEDEPESRASILQGLSDFYDFNASINPPHAKSPSRSTKRSVSPRIPKSRSISALPSLSTDFERSRSPSPSIYDEPKLEKRPPTPVRTLRKDADITELSDFYDFNVQLNKQAYNTSFSMKDAHRDSVDLVVEDLVFIQLQNSVKAFDTSNDIQSQCQLPKTPETPNAEVPETPEYARTLSYNVRDIERIKDEMVTNFKRSTYVGESLDFSDDFEQLREGMRNFRRSQSLSRSPSKSDDDISHDKKSQESTKKELQEKILEEITKTTINFQEFSRDMSQEFLEHERRGSDSALIQKPEILFQIEDDNRDFDDEDFMLNYMEAEEYHHFRRFSLHQEYQIEEYPEDDEIAYVQDIEVQTTDGAQTWNGEAIFDLEGKQNINETAAVVDITEVTMVSTETIEEPSSMNCINTDNEIPERDRIEEDLVSVAMEENAQIGDIDFADEEDYSDSISDDDRQTVVEVDDEIDEDLYDDNGRPAEESYNEQSECEEADRLVDQYANSNAEDWKEDEGAVGGVLDEEIEHMYDDAIKDRRESRIQRDYEGIVEKIGDESLSIRAEDLLDEILQEDDEKYGWSPMRRSRASSRESNISNRSNLPDGEHRYLGDAIAQSISSTRLRSRYGLGPARGSSANFENLDNVDLNYKPKRQYNWRKNFKLDEDDDDTAKSSKNNTKRLSDVSVFADSNLDHYDDTEQYLRKYSLGGESITLFSRSPNPSEFGDNLEDVPEQNESELRMESDPSSLQHTEKNEKEEKLHLPEFNENLIEKQQLFETELEEMEKLPKKKKIKKKVRKGSRASILSNEEGTISRRESLIPFEIPEEFPPEEEQPKKKKKKKRVKDTSIVGEASVAPENTTNYEINRSEKRKDSIKETSMSTISKLEEVTPIPKSTEPLVNELVSKTSSEQDLKEFKSDSSSVSSKELKSQSSSPGKLSNDLNPDLATTDKLDKINSTDVIDLIRDSGILGSSF